MMHSQDHRGPFRFPATLCSLLVLSGAANVTQTDRPEDQGWPRVFAKDDQRVVVYQPQVDEWENFEWIAFRMAIAVTPSGVKEPTYGVLEVQAPTVVDYEKRQVLVKEPASVVRFPNLSDAESVQLETLVRQVLPQRSSLIVSLDRVLAYLAPDATTVNGIEVSLEPPPIFYSQEPAILVTFFGRPQLEPVEGIELLFAVNANWDIFFDETSNSYYLLHGDSWLQSPDPVKGPWSAAKSLPPAFARIPATPAWEDVRKAVPPLQAGPAVRVFATTQPAELILVDGEPRYEPISGTRLMAIANTESVLFRHTGERAFYFLVAGRWFRAQSLQGPWSAASTALPDDFTRIPEDDPRAYVLASVPGTTEASDAILLASVPRKATVNVSEVAIDVQYAGEPKFEPIPQTTIVYAVNTPMTVFRVEDEYYCCHEGIWFVAPTATGSWSVCSSVPQVIYTIPPSHPTYNVTYVYVVESTPTTVTVQQTSGYSGEYVAATGVLMFGLGVLVGAALDDDDDYYHYGYHWHSYGCGAVYRGYAHGSYYRGGHVYGPYAGAGRAAAYNPSTGSWARAGYRYGPGGAVGYRQGYNNSTGTYAAQIGGANPYGSWSRGVVTRGDEWIAGGRESTDAGTKGWVETSAGGKAAGARTDEGSAFVAKDSEGDLYVGKDGNVYKREEDGSWQSRQADSWVQTQPGATPSQTGATRGQTGASTGQTGASRTRQTPTTTPSTSGRSRTTSTQPATRSLESEASARARGSHRASQSAATRSRGGRGGRG